MTNKSAAELEREAEVARARVANTAEALRSKMTPGQLIDEMTGMFAGGDGSAALNNLKGQIRDNPLPLTLVGAGLAWLMLGQGSNSRHTGTRHDSSAGALGYGSRKGWDGDYPTGDADLGDYETDSGDSSIARKVTSAAGSTMEMASDAAESVRQTFAGAAENIAENARGLADQSRGIRSQTRHAAEDMLEREPLVLAALGLTLGTAIGAMLPHTRLEDETMGKYGRTLRRAGEDLFEKGVEEAKDVAAEAYGAIKQEADRQGLGGDGQRTVADRVSEVLKSAVDQTEETVRDRVGSPEQMPHPREER